MGRQYNDPPPGRRKNEFQWEQELRREDCRISCYFRELPLCLDLPGEDEMIFENMQSYPGLIPAGASPGQWRIWDEPDFEHFCEEDAEQDFLQQRGMPSEWILRLDRMQVAWNMLAARVTDDEMIRIFLAVSCAFGKTMVHFSDFEETVLPELRPLKICLGKRTLEDIGELCGMLKVVAGFYPAVAGEVEGVIEDLLLMREFLMDRFSELRRSPDAG